MGQRFHIIFWVLWLLFFLIQCTKPSQLGSPEKLNSRIVSWYLLAGLETHEGPVNDNELDSLIRSIPETEIRLFAQQLRSDGKISVKLFREREVIILDPGVKDSKGKWYCYIIQPGAESIQYAARDDLD
jgi:hypothetical protein